MCVWFLHSMELGTERILTQCKHAKHSRETKAIRKRINELVVVVGATKCGKWDWIKLIKCIDNWVEKTNPSNSRLKWVRSTVLIDAGTRVRFIWNVCTYTASLFPFFRPGPTTDNCISIEPSLQLLYIQLNKIHKKGWNTYTITWYKMAGMPLGRSRKL